MPKMCSVAVTKMTMRFALFRFLTAMDATNNFEDAFIKDRTNHAMSKMRDAIIMGANSE